MNNIEKPIAPPSLKIRDGVRYNINLETQELRFKSIKTDNGYYSLDGKIKLSAPEYVKVIRDIRELCQEELESLAIRYILLNNRVNEHNSKLDKLKI